MNFIDTTHLFSLLLAIGASLALWRVALASPSAQRPQWLLAGWIVLLGALLGARLAYVLEHLPYYTLNPDQIIQFWQGGLSWIGVLPGALLLIPLVGKVWQWNFGYISDRLSVMLLPLSVATWLACLLEGSAYGAALPAGTWWGMRVLDASGVSTLRSPVQPIAALSLLVFLGLAELLLRSSSRPGLRTSLLIAIFGTDMLLFTFMRADPAQTWLGLRIESWAAIVTTFCAILSTISILGFTKRFPSPRWLKKKTVLESKVL